MNPLTGTHGQKGDVQMWKHTNTKILKNTKGK
jgi:hypothetical protein